jgi:hypothetical protein
MSKSAKKKIAEFEATVILIANQMSFMERQAYVAQKRGIIFNMTI